ncbi:MAG: hypothetical protein AAGD35_23740 [Actinomycetota bacterium]
MCCAAFALGFAVAGCTGAPVADGGAAGSGEADLPGVLAFDDGNGVEAALPDTLRLALAQPDTVTPAEVALLDQSAVITADLLYDGLTEAVGTDGELRPALATRWWPNAALDRWTFEIDTERVALEVVVDHIESILTGGSAQAPSTRQLFAGVTAVEAVETDDGAPAVAFVLDGPDAGFPWLMSGLGASIVGPEGAPTGWYDPTGPLAADVGPDTDDEADPAGGTSADGGAGDDDRILVLDAVDGATGLVPQQIEIHWADSTEDAYDTLTLGLVDGAVVPAAEMADAEQRFGHVPSARSATVFYVVATGGPDDDADAAVRRAIIATADPDALAIGLGPLGVMAGEGLVSPASAGASAFPVDPLPAPSGIGPDAPPRLDVTYIDPAHAELADAIAAGLADLGIQPAVRSVDTEEQVGLIAEGRPGLFAFGWVPAAGSIDAVIPALLGSGSSSNVLGYASPEIDALLAEGATTVDDERRWALYAEAHQLAMGEARAVPVGAATNRLVVAPHLSALALRADGSIDVHGGE